MRLYINGEDFIENIEKSNDLIVLEPFRQQSEFDKALIKAKRAFDAFARNDADRIIAQKRDIFGLFGSFLDFHYACLADTEAKENRMLQVGIRATQSSNPFHLSVKLIVVKKVSDETDFAERISGYAKALFVLDHLKVPREDIVDFSLAGQNINGRTVTGIEMYKALYRKHSKRTDSTKGPKPESVKQRKKAESTAASTRNSRASRERKLLLADYRVVLQFREQDGSYTDKLITEDQDIISLLYKIMETEND